MIFRIQLTRSSIAESAIHVEADSPGEAREIAEQRGRDDMVCWTECGDQIDSLAELASERGSV